MWGGGGGGAGVTRLVVGEGVGEAGEVAANLRPEAVGAAVGVDQ